MCMCVCACARVRNLSKIYYRIGALNRVPQHGERAAGMVWPEGNVYFRWVIY